MTDQQLHRHATDTSAEAQTARTELLSRIEALEAAGPSPADPAAGFDQAEPGRLERLGALQTREMAAAHERRRALERQRASAALKRLDVGEWGVCVRCGEDIRPERLRADPAVATCLPCARNS
ncbi:MAG: TraR/DksA C4-type zinc finger protein [Proteobacteria bacterium]|nr:TraR/DksA C4-type zinc finger protein [Pseudomonadota bacterium]